MNLWRMNSVINDCFVECNIMIYDGGVRISMMKRIEIGKMDNYRYVRYVPYDAVVISICMYVPVGEY